LSDIGPEDIQKIEYFTNFSQEDISSDTDIKKVFNTSSNHVWNMTVKSGSVIKESIFNQEIFSSFKLKNNPNPSAQVAIKIQLNHPKLISKIRINPNKKDDLDLLQIIVDSGNYKSTIDAEETSATQSYTLLGQSIRIKNSVDIDIPAESFVKSLTIVFGQRNYVRTKITPIQSEVNTQMVNRIANAVRVSRKKEHDKLQDTVIKYFIRDYASDYLIRNKKLYHYDYTDYYPTEYKKLNVGAIEAFKGKNFFSDLEDLNMFKNTSLLSNIVFSIISFSIGSKLRSTFTKTYIESNLTDTTKSVFNFSSGGIIPLSDSNQSANNLHFTEDSIDNISSIDTADLFNNVEDAGMYEYNFSIKNISLFTESYHTTQSSTYAPSTITLPGFVSPSYRSVFASKKIPLESLPMRVKMMAEYFSEIAYSEGDVSKDKTSIEFSISIKDSVTLEEDWMPIIPFGDSSIRTEVLYANSFGLASIRFAPSEETVAIYEDSKQKSFGTYKVEGKNITILDYNSSKKYFVSYSPININSFKEIYLFSKDMANPVLANASFNGLNGERFEKTDRDNRVVVSNYPYINQQKFVNAVYSSINGTITTSKSSFGNFDYSSYSPVKIIFEDGSSALNLTNYINSSSQVPFFYSSDMTLFIHSADSIIFNKYIDQPFRVVYQYVPAVFRYRVIMRTLNNTSENYSVDRLLFKFSTDKSSTIDNNFLKYDNKYKKKLS